MIRCEKTVRTSAKARRSRSWGRIAAGALLAGVSSLTGCGSTISPSAMRSEPLPDEIVVTTVDGRKIGFEGAAVWGSRLYGRVTKCSGSRYLAPEVWPVAEPASQWVPMPRGCLQAGERGSLGLHLIAEIEEPLGDGAKAGIAAGVVSGVVVVGTVIAGVAIMSSGSGMGGGGGMSCPRVYSFDGSDWHLDSGTYGAAYFEADQRTDHDLLEKLAEVDGEYRLRLANELDETEHVDALGLVVVDHPVGSQVVPAPDGELLTFTSPQKPLSAADLRGADARERVADRDGELWESDLSDRDPSRHEDTRDGLHLVFTKPRAASELKLSMTGMNTPEASQIVAHLLSLQGDQLPQVYERLNSSVIARKLLRRLYEGVGLLTVSVRTPEGWSQRGVFEAAGNEIAKGQALRIDISDIAGDRVELRLESAVGMWHVDQVLVDYTADVPVETHRLAPVRAVAEDGQDVRSTLTKIDAQRWSTEKGDWAELRFTAPTAPTNGMVRSIVLETTGYDTLHIEPAAEPDPDQANALMLSPSATSRRVLELLLASERERSP